MINLIDQVNNPELIKWSYQCKMKKLGRRKERILKMLQQLTGSKRFKACEVYAEVKSMPYKDLITIHEIDTNIRYSIIINKLGKNVLASYNPDDKFPLMRDRWIEIKNYFLS